VSFNIANEKLSDETNASEESDEIDIPELKSNEAPPQFKLISEVK
jgi:hypothetical protein